MNEREVAAFTAEALRKNTDGTYMHQYGIAFLICMNIGCRIGGLCALEVGDYDRQHHRIYIHRTINEFYDKNKAKIEKV